MKIGIKDVIRAIERPYPEFEVKKSKTALILIDVQKIASPEPFVKAAIAKGLPEKAVREAVKDYEERFWNAVKNIEKILKKCREKGLDIIHVKLEAPTDNPRHTAKVNRKIGLIVPPASEETEFLEEVKPIKGELVITKTNGGAFTGTNLDFILRNMDIDSFILVGFLTNECIAATAYHGADLGYDILLVEDACTTHLMELHRAIIDTLADMCLKVKSTDQVLEILEKLE